MALRYTTFNLVYRERWADVLRFRSRSLFTTCEVCCAFKSQLQDRTLSFEQKLGCLQGYRKHLHDQYCDRTMIWTLQSEGSDPNAGVLMICTDGLDQAKFSLPRDPQLRSNAGLNLCQMFGPLNVSLLTPNAYQYQHPKFSMTGLGIPAVCPISGPNTSGLG